MKKIYVRINGNLKKIIAPLLLVLLTVPAFSLIKVISISDGNGFVPTHQGVLVGDTIKWVWTGPTPHSTTSLSIPGGASVWNVTLDSTTSFYMYKVTVGGTFFYHSILLPDS